MPTDTQSTTVEATAVSDRLREWLIIYCKGMAMGAADAVPGVSGGTIAFITGIYERLIAAVTALDPTVVRFLPRVHRREDRVAFWKRLLEMDVPFLVSLGAGMVTAVVILARIVHAALSAFPGPTFAFFFGLIAASAIALFRRDWLGSWSRVAAAGVGGVLAFLIAGETVTGALPHSLPVVFVAGAIAISGMLLPGISGAFILVLLGQYEYMTENLNKLIDSGIAMLTGEGSKAFLDAASVVVTFLSGAIVGLFTVAYVVRWALRTYRGPTLSFLVGLMVGALRYPAAEILAETGNWSPTVGLGIVAAGVLGAGIVLVLDRYTEDLEYESTASQL